VAGVWEAGALVTVCVTAATCTETPAAAADVGARTQGIDTAITSAVNQRLNDAIPRLILRLLGR
jgi:hypothetical protein